MKRKGLIKQRIPLGATMVISQRDVTHTDRTHPKSTKLTLTTMSPRPPFLQKFTSPPTKQLLQQRTSPTAITLSTTEQLGNWGNSDHLRTNTFKAVCVTKSLNSHWKRHFSLY
jgi:hypothetical protein